MSNLLNINKGFEAMIPKAPESEEVACKETEVVKHQIKFSAFGTEFAFSFTVTRS